MKIAVVGNADESLGFCLAGVIPKPVDNESEFIDVVQELYRDKQIGVIIIVDRYFDIYSQKFTKNSKKSALPAVVFVPSIDKKYLQRDLKGFLANVLGIKL